jgi:hypothetical protein
MEAVAGRRAAGDAPDDLVQVLDRTAGRLGSQSAAELLTRIADPGRYTQIATSFFQRLAAMGAGPGHPLILLAILAPLLRRQGDRRHAAPVWVSGSVLITMLLSYCAVFVITPRDLRFHLNAWDRLFVQLWPATVLLFCRLLPGEGLWGTRKLTENQPEGTENRAATG